MESTILSNQNIENIFDYVNTELVKKHNINLQNQEEQAKYKKIVKKLTKTVMNFNKNKINTINLDTFNNMVVNKSVPFIVNHLQESRLKSHVPKKSKKKQFNLGAYGETQLSTQRNLIQSEPTRPLSSPPSTNYSTFLESQSTFDSLVKESNKKIKDNFKKFLQVDTFKKDVECSNTTNPFIVDRCILKDEIDSNKLDANAFEKIMKAKMDEPTPTTSSPESTGPTLSSSVGSYENYDQVNVKDLLTSIVYKQKDHSKGDQLETYQEEGYIQNLITPIGEEAEVQPLLYQTTGQGVERVDKKIFVIDSGTKTGGKLDLTADPYNTITNLGTSGNYWHKYRAKFEDTIKIEKLTDVYLRSFSIIGAVVNSTTGYFCLNIEEFNIRTLSNNVNMKNRIIIKNTLTSAGNMSVDYPSMSNYVTTINPVNLLNLNITLTNENNESADTTGNLIFTDKEATTNRVIFELEFVTRGERDSVIV